MSADEDRHRFLLVLVEWLRVKTKSAASTGRPRAAGVLKMSERA
jgi:hypothetical protein